MKDKYDKKNFNLVSSTDMKISHFCFNSQFRLINTICVNGWQHANKLMCTEITVNTAIARLTFFFRKKVIFFLSNNEAYELMLVV